MAALGGEPRALLPEQLDADVERVKKEILSAHIPDDSTLRSVYALQLASDSGECWRAGDTAAALGRLSAAVEIDPGCHIAHYEMAWHYVSLGEEMHKPFMGSVVVGMADTYAQALAPRMTYYRRAIENLKKALEIHPGRAAAWCLLGKVEYLTGDVDAARAAFQEAVRLDGSGPDGRLARSNLQLMESRASQAGP
ncbi:MAG: tetratricopeptide repeat protein [Bacillota bacterium]|nr:tetratricopeptide repeat protein [Bacillota bacterium]